MLMTEKKLSRGVGDQLKSWPWLCVAALSGLMLSAPVMMSHWRRGTYKKQEEWVSAYARGCLDRNGRSS